MIETDHFQKAGSGDCPIRAGGEKRDCAENKSAQFDHAFWIIIVKFFQVSSHAFHNSLVGGFAKCFVDGIAAVNDPEDHCDNQYFNSAYHVVLVKGVYPLFRGTTRLVSFFSPEAGAAFLAQRNP